MAAIMSARAAITSARPRSCVGRPTRRGVASSRAVAAPPIVASSNALLGDDCTILEAALERAELTEAVTGGKALTVFAPSDAAFMKLCDDLQLSKEEVLGLDSLADILTYHVVEGRVGHTGGERTRSTRNPGGGGRSAGTPRPEAERYLTAPR